LKLISYITLISGILLLVSSIVLNFMGTMGYLLTLLAVSLMIVGIVTNNKLREFVINLFINLF